MKWIFHFLGDYCNPVIQSHKAWGIFVVERQYPDAVIKVNCISEKRLFGSSKTLV